MPTHFLTRFLTCTPQQPVEAQDGSEHPQAEADMHDTRRSGTSSQLKRRRDRKASRGSGGKDKLAAVTSQAIEKIHEAPSQNEESAGGYPTVL